MSGLYPRLTQESIVIFGIKCLKLSWSYDEIASIIGFVFFFTWKMVMG